MCAACHDRKPFGFVACSRACLDKHRKSAHPGVKDMGVREELAAFFASLNAKASSWEPYTSHRQRLMGLVQAVQRGEGICVLGAGNCDDLDLPLLVRTFGAVHLVDLDVEAMARAVARVPEPQRARISTQGPIDLTGMLDRIDDFAERLPPPDELAGLARAGADAIAAVVGRTFDVVLSGCVLSQLHVAFRQTLALPQREWNLLFATLSLLHLRTLALLTREGGTSVLAADVLSSRVEPKLDELDSPLRQSDLEALLNAKLNANQLAAGADPRQLVALLQESPLLSGLIEGPRLTPPWLWRGLDRRNAVYGLVFRRA